MKIFNLIIFLLISSSITSLFAQKGYKNFKWKKQSNRLTTLPDSLQNEDAVVLFHYYTLRPEIDPRYVKWANTVIIHHQRIKILTEKGLDDFSNIIIQKSSKESVIYVDAFTVKPDGKIIDLDAGTIELNLYETNSNKNFTLKELRFAIPGVEVGDEIEMITKTKLPFLRTSDDLYFHQNLPVLNAAITINVPVTLLIKLSSYNRLDAPEIIENGKNTTYQWRVSGLRPMYYQDYSVYANELPYISYNINFLPQQNWEELYVAYHNTYEDKDFQGRPHSTYFLEFMQDNAKKYPEYDSLQMFNHVLNFIQDSLSLEVLNEDESNMPIGHFLYERRIDNHNLHILYRKVLDYLKIEYWTCFGRNKYNGPIDTKFPTVHQIDYVFYTFENKLGEQQFLYPSSSEMTYYLNEIPVTLEGTTCIALAGKNAESVRIKFKTFVVPLSTIRDNSLIKSIVYKYSEQDRLKNVIHKEVYKGSYMRGARDYKTNLVEYSEWITDNYDVPVDSISFRFTSDSNPYAYEVKYTHPGTDYLNQVEEGLYSVSIADLIHHNNLEDNKEKDRFMGFYPVMAYSDKVNVLLQFNHPVKIMNEEGLDQKLSNGFASYAIRFSQPTPQSILLTSKYAIKATYLSAGQYEMFISVNEMMESAMNQELYIGTVD